MSNPVSSSEPQAPATHEEMMTALFANLVMQHTNMAFIFLGRMPHPETGQIVQDFESSKFFIDQLVMLEAKTKGNLTKDEETLLKQSLTSLRLAFVDAVTKAPAGPGPAAEQTAPAAEPAKASEVKTEAATPETAEAKPGDDDSRKKFSKKY